MALGEAVMATRLFFRTQPRARRVLGRWKALFATTKTNVAAWQFDTARLMADEFFVLLEASDVHCMIAWKSFFPNYQQALGGGASTYLANLMSATAQSLFANRILTGPTLFETHLLAFMATSQNLVAGFPAWYSIMGGRIMARLKA